MIQQIKHKIIKLLCNEWYITRSERKRFFAEAQKCFSDEQPPHGSLKEYLYCLNKYRITYPEYMHQYEFWRLDDTQRKEYVSVSEMQKFYRRIVKPEIRSLMRNKQDFLRFYSRFIHREWLYVPDCTDARIIDLISRHKVIAKPKDGSRGQGIFFVEQGAYPDSVTLQQWRENKILLEECVNGHAKIEAFNPESLNTIRVLTFRHDDEVLFYTAAIRFGRKGYHVDNAHAGGIRALIDPETGVTEEGVDTQGNRYATHPDSGLPIKGFTIPEWDKVREVCKEACLQTPGLVVCGWDVCVREDGQVELIEGNHAPDIDGVQFSKQKGIRKELNDIFNRLYKTTL